MRQVSCRKCRCNAYPHTTSAYTPTPTRPPALHAGQPRVFARARVFAVQVVVLAVQKRVLGKEHPSTLLSAHILASTYSDQGKHAEAEALQVVTLAVAKRVLGDRHPHTVVFARALAASDRKRTAATAGALVTLLMACGV